MKRSSLTRTLVISLLGLVVIGIAGERLLSLWLEKKLNRWAATRNVSIGSLSVSVAGRSIRAHDVRWPADPKVGSQPDTAHIALENLTLRGIGLFQLVNKKVDISTIVAEDGDIYLPSREHEGVNDPPTDDVMSIAGFHADRVRLINARVTYKSDSVTSWSALTNLTLHQLELQDPSTPALIASYQIEGAELSLADVNMKELGGFYSMHIGQVGFDRKAQTLTVDSLSLIPTYPKLEFAHKRGTQSTWAAVHVPLIRVRGLDLKQHQDSTLTASHILLKDVRIDAFRDRRVPLKPKPEVPLPMKWLRELQLAIEVDSVQVANMEVVYEHVSEDGFEPGKMSFTQLQGLFVNINNRGYDNLPRTTTLTASTLVMGRAKLEAQFTFPLDPGKPYTAKGRIGQLQLTALNPMLENAAFVSVESGQLKELTFQFQYNNDVSRGDLHIDYNELKVKGLQKTHAGNVNVVKTLVANTALKNSNSASGEILTERDKQRFIFHYWAHSLLDGIRSAVMPAAANRKAK